jgi:hypothetical protein
VTGAAPASAMIRRRVYEAPVLLAKEQGWGKILTVQVEQGIALQGFILRSRNILAISLLRLSGSGTWRARSWRAPCDYVTVEAAAEFTDGVRGSAVG